MTINKHLESQGGAVRRTGRVEWIALGALLLSLLLVSVDASVLLYAVPFITKPLHPSSTQQLCSTRQLWMHDVYGFVFAGLLITVGSVGGRIGRRRLLLVGAFRFSVASLGAAYASSAGELIAARAVRGITGPTLVPSTLAQIRDIFREPGQAADGSCSYAASMRASELRRWHSRGAWRRHSFAGAGAVSNMPVIRGVPGVRSSSTSIWGGYIWRVYRASSAVHGESAGRCRR